LIAKNHAFLRSTVHVSLPTPDFRVSFRPLAIMEWYKILGLVICCLVGSYLLLILVLFLEYPQRQYVLLNN
jgi:hypothetical protein